MNDKPKQDTKMSGSGYKLHKREFKFRVWGRFRKNDHWRMYEPDYGLHIGSNGGVYQCQADSGYGYGGGDSESFQEAIPMQFTGLRDKNGKEIYEGDILQPHRHTKVVLLRCEVYFDAGAFRLRGPQHTDRPLAVCMGDASRAGNDYVIIGNIHEHPELLNQTGH